MEKYEKICLIDAGSYGEVFKCRARDRDGDHIVAIKRSLSTLKLAAVPGLFFVYFRSLQTLAQFCSK